MKNKLDVTSYLDKIAKKAMSELNKSFDIKKLEFNNFEQINSYLIHVSLNKDYNTLIQIPDKELKSQFYLPAIITVAIYDFIDNWIDNEPNFQVGDIIQKNGKRKEIVNITSENSYEVIGNNKARFTIKKEQIKTYIRTNADLTKGKPKLKFNEYKKFFSEILREGQLQFLPSVFKYKSVIITDKSIANELKQYKVNNDNIHKAFPFRYVTKTGKIADNIPIDPMIYIVNDYDTFREHILSKGMNVRNVIIIGRNKYNEQYSNISSDLRNEKFESCVLIGSSDVPQNAIPNLLGWHWTEAELNYFDCFETHPISEKTTQIPQFENSIQVFHNKIEQIENKYDINLKELYKYVRRIMPLITPSSESRLTIQLDNVFEYFQRHGKDIVETSFYEIDEYDYENEWFEILDIFSEIIRLKKTDTSKMVTLKEFHKIDYLVVSKQYLTIWQEELKDKKVKNIIDYQSYKQLEKKNKIIVFLGFYGYEHLKSMMYTPNKIHILLHPTEKEHFDSCIQRIGKDTFQKINEQDRVTLSGMEFRVKKEDESVNELINRLFEHQKKENIGEESNDSDSDLSLVRRIEFDDGHSMELDDSKKVLLQIGDKERQEIVGNLTSGDCIRVYDNSSKEELYQVALNADEEGQFSEIEKYSHLWKAELNDYYKNNFSSLTGLHNKLVQEGLTILNENTLKNWLNCESSVKFPQSRKNLLILKKGIDSDVLRNNYPQTLKYRNLYFSLMPSLGLNFSAEIAEYIQNKRKGKFLKQFSKKQIEQFVAQNAKQRSIKSIEIVGYE